MGQAGSAGIAFANVSYGLPDGRMLLHGIDLDLDPDTVTALLGRSGSGKTTLLRMVNGLAMPTSGSILVGGRSTADWPLLELRRGIGYVIQESGLFPHWTAERNIGLALELAGEPASRRHERAAELLALVGLEPSLGTRFPWQLSGGQRQRVGLARALAAEPQVLLMDEPFGALDPITRAEMQTMLRDLLQRVRKTVLLVTHDLDEALYLAGRIVLLEQGRVVADLRAEEVAGSQIAEVQEYVAAVRHGVAR